LTFSPVLQEQFDREFGDLVVKAKLVNAMEALQQVKSTESEDVRMEYHTHLDFGHLAHQFGVFQEWKVSILLCGELSSLKKTLYPFVSTRAVACLKPGEYV
jgi:hypothetical protein